MAKGALRLGLLTRAWACGGASRRLGAGPVRVRIRVRVGVRVRVRVRARARARVRVWLH